ncbi:hypothetical protein ACP70R_017538 [Stipagrostis hirtigluma subsp. patula]
MHVSGMGACRVPRAAVLFGAFAALLAVFGVGAAAAAAPVVVGSVKCLDCSPSGADAEDVFQGLQVAIKCKSGADETYETKALAPLDGTGVFSIPLAAELLREDGELGRDCFAQLHSAPNTPCVGQAPPRIAPAGPGQDGTTTTTYLAAATDTAFSPVACKCGKKKKHFMFGPPPPPPKPEDPKPPTPTYGPPTPTPVPDPKPQPQPEPEPEPHPFFHKHPKMKFMHKKKPCPPLADDDTARPADGGQDKAPKTPN